MEKIYRKILSELVYSTTIKYVVTFDPNSETIYIQVEGDQMFPTTLFRVLTSFGKKYNFFVDLTPVSHKLRVVFYKYK